MRNFEKIKRVLEEEGFTNTGHSLVSNTITRHRFVNKYGETASFYEDIEITKQLEANKLIKQSNSHPVTGKVTQKEAEELLFKQTCKRDTDD